MKQEEINKNNKLIAEFMKAKRGYYARTYVNDELFSEIPKKFNKKETCEAFIAKHQCLTVQEYKAVFVTPEYSKSWNDLMPVVEKIENTHHYQDFIIGGSRVEIKSFSAFDDCFEKLIDEESKMEAVYVAIVEFIKWYNENK